MKHLTQTKVILAISVALTSPDTGNANLLGDTIRSNTEAQVRVILKQAGMRREFMYCYMDILVFDDINTKNCTASIDAINEVLETVGAGEIAYHDKSLMKSVLQFMYDQRGKQ